MKYIKSFENLKYKIGDYVLFNIDNNIFYQFKNFDINNYYKFINNNIGKIIYIPPIEDEPLYHIQYENIPYEIENFFYTSKLKNGKLIKYDTLYPYNIIYSSPNKKM